MPGTIGRKASAFHPVGGCRNGPITEHTTRVPLTQQPKDHEKFLRLLRDFVTDLAHFCNSSAATDGYNYPKITE